MLNKAHFEECYSASVSPVISASQFYKAAALSGIGLALLLFSQTSAYLAWFLIALGVLDAVSVRYQKPWWVTRQMLSRAAGSEVLLTINSVGIHNKSHYIDQLITWSEISDVETTAHGLLIHHQQGKSYLSKSLISTAANDYIFAQVDTERTTETATIK